MREPGGKRLVHAALFALATAAVLAIGNPMDRVKADLRADAQGLALSLEVSARAIGL